jgi:hypothetical protein
VSALYACPFCRELFQKDEAERCPDCDVVLKPLHELPPSYEALEEEAVAWEQTSPDDVPLPLFHLGRGRAALVALCLSSLAAFFWLPWVEIEQPYRQLYSGYDLARGRLGWLWGGAVGWFVMLALIASRRSVHAMRGVRPILAMFAAMTLSEVALLFVLSPVGHGRVRFEYSWSFGIYVALALSLAGVLVALRFGGALGGSAGSPKRRKLRATEVNPTLH